jgi:hypothetical protein
MKTIFLAGLLACAAAAQQAAEPPPIIQVVRKLGTRLPPGRQYASAGAAVNVLGMAAITGPQETWLLECHDSFDSIETLDRALAAYFGQTPSDELEPARTLIAFYRPGWSYRAEQAVRMLPRAHYFHVTIYQIHSGEEAGFGDLIKARRLNLDSVNLDRPDLAYQVISGAPSGTYVFLAPLVSLRTMDDAVATLPYFAENVARREAKEAEAISAKLEVSRQHLLLRVEPRLSYVSDDFAEADPEFWRGKPGDSRD